MPDEIKQEIVDVGKTDANLPSKVETQNVESISPMQKQMNLSADIPVSDEKLKISTEEQPPVKQKEVLSVNTEKTGGGTETTPVTLEQVEKARAEWQRKYDKTVAEYEKFKKDSEARLKEYTENPIEAIRKYQPQVLENLEAAANPDAFIAKWQETELVKRLKEKFPNEVDEMWEFNPVEAYKAGTPSYMYRVATEEKRQEIINSLRSRKESEAIIVKKYTEQRDADMKFLSELYNWDEETLKSKLADFDAIHGKVLAGEVKAEKHPLALRNLLRGYYFDELVKIHTDRAVEKAIAELKEQYKVKGIALQESSPTDVTKAREANSTVPEPTNGKSRNPMQRQMERFM